MCPRHPFMCFRGPFIATTAPALLESSVPDRIDLREIQASNMGIEERTLERRKRMVAHVATSFEDAEAWDLDFWQKMTPEERLSALVAIRRDVEVVKAARDTDSPDEI